MIYIYHGLGGARFDGKVTTKISVFVLYAEQLKIDNFIATDAKIV